MSINHPTTLDAAIQIETYLTDMRHEYLPNDIFDSMASEYINATGEEPQSLPNSIYLRLTSEADKARTTKVAMIKELSGAPTLGSLGDQRLREEDWVTKHFTMQYTDLSHATTNQNFGILARDKAPYKIFEYRTQGMAKYFKQYFGKMRRQTLLERQSENLEDAPHFNAAGFSPNWFIPNLEFDQQPVYTRNTADWTDRIVAKLTQAGTGAQCAANPMYFLHLNDWAREQNIVPIEFGDGTDGYIVTLPTPQATWFKHLVQTGSGGWLWKDASSLTGPIWDKFPLKIGKFNNMLIVEDIRYPTLTLGGSASYGQQGDGYYYDSDSGIDYTLTAQYRGMGRADDGSSDPRDKSTSARQVGFLIGQAAICEWMPEGFHWEWEYEQYDKYYGSGIFCSVGMKQPIFDNTDGVDDDDDTIVRQDGSAVLPFCHVPRTYYYSSPV